jgi:hypothetical protein
MVTSGAAFRHAACGRVPAPRKLQGEQSCDSSLALYNAAGTLVGALGVSGDTSYADHIIAWKTRHALNLDNVPAGVAGPGKDNIIHDVVEDPTTGHTKSAGGFGHPTCSAASTAIATALPATHPTGPTP